MSDGKKTSDKPPCPECGDRYDAFVWKSNVKDSEAPSSDCETGLGWYIHD